MCCTRVQQHHLSMRLQVWQSHHFQVWHTQRLQQLSGFCQQFSGRRNGSWSSPLIHLRSCTRWSPKGVTLSTQSWTISACTGGSLISCWACSYTIMTFSNWSLLDSRFVVGCICILISTTTSSPQTRIVGRRFVVAVALDFAFSFSVIFAATDPASTVLVLDALPRVRPFAAATSFASSVALEELAWLLRHRSWVSLAGLVAIVARGQPGFWGEFDASVSICLSLTGVLTFVVVVEDDFSKLSVSASASRHWLKLQIDCSVGRWSSASCCRLVESLNAAWESSLAIWTTAASSAFINSTPSGKLASTSLALAKYRRHVLRDEANSCIEDAFCSDVNWPKRIAFSPGPPGWCRT